MQISLVRLPVDGLAFRHQYTADELDTSKHEFELESSPLVTGRVTRSGMDVRVKGEIKAVLNAQCDRCLTAVPVSIESPFDLIYVPDDPGAGQPGEHEVLDRDLGVATYENEQINVDDLVLEQLELSLPKQP